MGRTDTCTEGYDTEVDELVTEENRLRGRLSLDTSGRRAVVLIALHTRRLTEVSLAVKHKEWAGPQGRIQPITHARRGA
jgi:hypothetical protein